MHKRKYQLFIKAWVKRIWEWLWAHYLFFLLVIIRFFPIRFGLSFFSCLAAWIGPLTPRHKIALINLRAAYPEKTNQEIRKIALEMWRNMGQLLAEYVYLDKIFDFDPYSPQKGRIEVSGVELFEKIRQDNKPHIFFTAHIGNFELLPICAATFGLPMTSLFRSPNNPYIAKRVHKLRFGKMGDLIPSQSGAAWSLAHQLQKGGNIGILVDQKFQRGSLGRFFNRPVHSNPLLAKLVRQFECDVYPARCIRLSKGKYRLELFPALELPYNKDHSIHIEQLTQQLNNIVELWVREYPEQWMWFHKRWGDIDP